MTVLRLLPLILLSAIVSFYPSYTIMAQSDDLNAELNRPYQTMIKAYAELNAELMKEVYHDSSFYLSPFPPTPWSFPKGRADSYSSLQF